ncbi:uncharacterized protein L969DRAFT_51122 [Mixia osmundae IAM 14324]|uniref:3'(2'),5'-bisphosphate nucleotidase n=1 Tax=Mixia osmundae (strain CBS 9802 / IAM 14324 / JCM 22182 / KY 12970) TaxID=764103 RepID=G7E7V3_MIXOS|nr:uncharacterized protein L969DRAFT_51122 [Mixia osmundae IAM 14324]KEI38514.1 hypothetical protein L969DRAFT_51122 [Mixia osmundae IAM 14324]GAA98913.1 hypothetical protein E5Q_05601 [Mixia osmundae IAM 14324]
MLARLGALRRQMTSLTSATNPYAKETAVAISAVLKASLVADRVFQKLVSTDSVTKDDKSPVTVGDYTAQALVSTLLHHHFPSYGIVGEEDSKDLKTVQQKVLSDKIVHFANWALDSQAGTDQDHSYWSPIGKEQRTETEWHEAIDRGNAESAATGRTWALDPIDGTKGFLRKGQYAVCLALIQDGEPVLGVTGCPNLPIDFEDNTSSKGTLFVAVKGQGAYQRSFDNEQLTPIHFAPIGSLADASFCESVEAGHSDQSTNARIASLLGITKQPTRMDSQAKYCSISRGDGDIYLRLPVKAGYQEKIWDHASGTVLVGEAGGIVTDMHGKKLDFGQGRTLKANQGVVAANKDVHAKVLRAVQQALADK